MLTSQTRYGASLKKDGLVQSNKTSGYQPPVSEALYDSSVEHNGYQTLLTDIQDPSTIQTGYQADRQLAGITDKGYQLGQSTGSDNSGLLSCRKRLLCFQVGNDPRFLLFNKI